MKNTIKILFTVGVLISSTAADDNQSWYEKGKAYASTVSVEDMKIDTNGTLYKDTVKYGSRIGTYAKIYGKKIYAYMSDLYNSLFNDLKDSGVMVENKKEFICITVPGSIAFDFDQSGIKYEFEAVLRDISKNLLKYDKVKVEVNGYTDSTGTKEYNLKLSKERALSVYRALSLLGIDRSKMNFKGLASINPIASNETKEGRAMNRRVEIKIFFVDTL